MLAARVGYGFTDSFDAEAKVGFFDGPTYVGADGEFWMLKRGDEYGGVDFSLAGGVHGVFGQIGIALNDESSTCAGVGIA
ncbi:MAG: hypothetical protein JXA57_19425 [Armatimonadetes bacterium]|nr:hypothetical protein [Armatimonadota bacterium]